MRIKPSLRLNSGWWFLAIPLLLGITLIGVVASKALAQQRGQEPVVRRPIARGEIPNLPGRVAQIESLPSQPAYPTATQPSAPAFIPVQDPAFPMAGTFTPMGLNSTQPAVVAGFAASPSRMNSAEREAAAIAGRLRRMPEEARGEAELKQLEELLTNAFESKHDAQVARLEQVKESIAETEKILAKRAEKKDEIVQRRMKELLGEKDPYNFNWDYPGSGTASIPPSIPPTAFGTLPTAQGFAQPAPTPNFGSTTAPTYRNLPQLNQPPTTQWAPGQRNQFGPQSSQTQSQSPNERNRFNGEATTETIRRPSSSRLPSTSAFGSANPSSRQSSGQSSSRNSGLSLNTIDRNNQSGSRDSSQSLRGRSRTQSLSGSIQGQGQTSQSNNLSRANNQTQRSTQGSDPNLVVGLPIKIDAMVQRYDQMRKLYERGAVSYTELRNLNSEILALKSSLDYAVQQLEHEVSKAQLQTKFAERTLELAKSKQRRAGLSSEQRITYEQEYVKAQHDLEMAILELNNAAARLDQIKSNDKSKKSDEKTGEEGASEESESDASDSPRRARPKRSGSSSAASTSAEAEAEVDASTEAASETEDAVEASSDAANDSDDALSRQDAKGFLDLLRSSEEEDADEAPVRGRIAR